MKCNISATGCATSRAVVGCGKISASQGTWGWHFHLQYPSCRSNWRSLHHRNTHLVPAIRKNLLPPTGLETKISCEIIRCCWDEGEYLAMQQELKTHLKLHSKFTFYLQIYYFFCTSWTICAQIVARRESVAVPGRKDERITHKKMACQDIHNRGCGCWRPNVISHMEWLTFEKLHGESTHPRILNINKNLPFLGDLSSNHRQKHHMRCQRFSRFCFILGSTAGALGCKNLKVLFLKLFLQDI